MILNGGLEDLVNHHKIIHPRFGNIEFPGFGTNGIKIVNGAIGIFFEEIGIRGSAPRTL